MPAERAAMDRFTLPAAEGQGRRAEDGGSPVRALAFHRRRSGSRHRRDLAGLKALAAVRRIDLMGQFRPGRAGGGASPPGRSPPVHLAETKAPTDSS